MKRSCPWKLVGQADDKNYQSRTPYWTIAFSRYVDPISAYAKDGTPPNAQEMLQIIENDAIAVSISNSKESFGKTAAINLKITNVNYPALINNGDWCFIWMNESKSKNDQIIDELKKVRENKTSQILARYDSGLKFIGRVTSTSLSDRLSGGTRTLSSVIQAQSFLELASSIYYLYNPEEALAATPPPSAQKASLANSALLDTANFQSLKLTAGLDKSLQNLAKEFKSVFDSGSLTDRSPDIITGLWFAMVMGVTDIGGLSELVGGVKATYAQGIFPTTHVFNILNIRGQKLWETYRLYLGMQSYRTGNDNWQTKFAPITSVPRSGNNVVRLSPIRCKGLVQYTPPEWTNRSLWSIMTDYVNPVCNEMFTSLRLDSEGYLRPSIVMREMPFSTGNWKKIKSNNAMKVDIQPASDITNSVDLIKSAQAIMPDAAKQFQPPSNVFGKTPEAQSSVNKERTYYGSIPRWVIDESVILSFDWHTDEAERINFVQVFGTSGAIDMFGQDLPQEVKIRNQLQAGNYVVDELDIARNGMRVHAVETNFDFPTQGDVVSSFAPVWARMIADWKFNGHLKAKGTITIVGTEDPIAEGDNLEVRGILFHIVSVNHNASISSSGVKQWVTTITVKSGVLASSLSNPEASPAYIVTQKGNIYNANTPGPGFTEVQERRSGEPTRPPDNKNKIFQ